MTGGADALRLEGVDVSYGHHLALQDVTATVRAGRVVGLLGPNGAGKTTLFRTLVGLLKPDRGRLDVFGRPANRRGRRTEVAYVPQESAFDRNVPLTVLDVVVTGRYGHLGWCRRPGDRERRYALEALDRVDLTPLADRPFRALSGGQRQRVFLARALCQDARLLLLDEPFTGVDAGSQEIILDTLRSLRAEGRTLVVATHDLASVPTFCDDVLLVNRTVVASGPLEATYTPGNLERTFGGRLVLLDAGAPPSTPPGAGGAADA